MAMQAFHDAFLTENGDSIGYIHTTSDSQNYLHMRKLYCYRCRGYFFIFTFLKTWNLLVPANLRSLAVGESRI